MTSSTFLKKLVLFVVLGWCFLLLYFRSSLVPESSGEGVVSLEERLRQANQDLLTVKAQSQRLVVAMRELKRIRKNGFSQDANVLIEPSGGGLSVGHETLRRRTENGIYEMWYLLSDALHQVDLEQGKGSKLSARVQEMFNVANDQRQAVLAHLQLLSGVDGTGEWRVKELDRLAGVLRQRIHKLQNPPDCSRAKKLVCNLNKGCGFGCQAHHALFCFLLAYSTGRTFILQSAAWRYSRNGWESVFLPLSSNCTKLGLGEIQLQWGVGEWERATVVEVPIIDNLRSRPNFLPQAVPEDMADKLSLLHGAPFVWFAGHMISYLLRPNPGFATEIDRAVARLGFSSRGTVGVHVRRTDKVGLEAAFHPIEEYMKHVGDYFKMMEARADYGGEKSQVQGQRSVYLATDEPRLLEEARQKYPNYTFISDNEISLSAAVSSRYSDKALRGVLLDIVLLSRTDYLVCTFSSQVCRVAYELMQTRHAEMGDASRQFRSLDDIYYFGGQNEHQVRALVSHKATKGGEISFERGDLIKIAGNHWNGYSKGLNIRTHQSGLFPSYKTEFALRRAQMGPYTGPYDVDGNGNSPKL